MAGERFGAIPFRSIVKTVHTAQADTVVHLATTELPWSSHRSYNITLFRDSAMKGSRVHEQKKARLVLLYCKEEACSG